MNQDTMSEAVRALMEGSKLGPAPRLWNILVTVGDCLWPDAVCILQME